MNAPDEKRRPSSGGGPSNDSVKSVQPDSTPRVRHEHEHPRERDYPESHDATQRCGLVGPHRSELFVQDPAFCQWCTDEETQGFVCLHVVWYDRDAGGLLLTDDSLDSGVVVCAWSLCGER